MAWAGREPSQAQAEATTLNPQVRALKAVEAETQDLEALTWEPQTPALEAVPTLIVYRQSPLIEL